MNTSTKPFVVCIDSADYRASLIPGKVYRILPDARAAKDDLVRIVDESGEDYLSQKSLCVCGLSARREEEDSCPGERWLISRLGMRIDLRVAAGYAKAQ